MKTLFALFLNLVLLTQVIISQTNNSWRGPNRDGHFPDVNLLKSWPADGPRMVWAYENLGIGFSSPVIVGGNIFITGLEGENGYVYVLSDMGVFQRKFRYGRDFSASYPGARSTPVIVGNLLYMITGYGELVSMDIITGRRIWSKDLFRDFDGSNIRFGFTENMVIDGDVIYVSPGGRRYNVVALNRHSGDLIWESRGRGTLSAYGSPLLITRGGNKILVSLMNSHVLGIDASNGNVLWSHPFVNTHNIHPNTPIYYNGELYVFTGYGKGGYKLRLNADGTNISQVWQNVLLDPKTGGAVLVDGFIYGSGDRNRRWFGVDWNTGEVISESRSIDAGTVISADGMLYAYSERGELALLKPNRGNFNIVGQTSIVLGSDQHWAHKVINNGILYVRRGNALMAYDIRN